MTGHRRAALHFDNLSLAMVKEFPELRERYTKELEWWGDEKPGQHVIYGDIFTPYLVDLLESGRGPNQLKRAFSFLENMLSCEDVKVQEVAVVTVLEYFHGKPKLLDLAKPYFGPLAVSAIHDLDEFSRGQRDWIQKTDQ